jgi:SAM-dependent methyltransferase
VSRGWLDAAWPLVRDHLPPPPARVLDLGCGGQGGFVPALLADGFDAVGVDPAAPDGTHYVRAEFERADLPASLDAVVASLSLHHVADPAAIIDRIAGLLAPDGTVVVLEWASERMDEETARWCFERLGPDDAPTWLHRRRDEWQASRKAWPRFLRDWATEHGIHRGDDVVQLLDARLGRRLLDDGAYFFPDLADTSETEEREAIGAGRIQAARIRWVGENRQGGSRRGRLL